MIARPSKPGKCPRCGGHQFIEHDPEDGMPTLRCLNGHLNGYVEKDGSVTPAGLPAGKLERLIRQMERDDDDWGAA